MIELTNAAMYSTKGEIAYQADYSDGTSVRAVYGRDGMIRQEWKAGAEWKPAGKPYVVRKDKKRQAERLVENVKAWLA
jgi:hypothetical protein